jgi:4,5-DOPA dioxygenase extradiol
MKRLEFIKLSSSLLLTHMNISSFGNLVKETTDSPIMPVLFIGHGSPMNAIETNLYTQKLNTLGKNLEKPKAILVVSAHWQTKGTYVNVSSIPKTIHDFSGFPKALFDVQYPAKGAPEFAKQVSDHVTHTQVLHDTDWGLDHGAWSVLKHLFPQADIPVFQLSLDFNQGSKYHYDLAKQLQFLRSKGVLIIGSGNIVHNLGMIDWRRKEGGYDWAIEFDNQVSKNLISRNHDMLVDYYKMGKAATLSIPTNEHYLPMLYAAALQQKSEQLEFIYDEMQMGSISMRCFIIHGK